ncbi:hypothetical protein F4677DRAFT_441555 [Hypoxylon crocopeplum]|nr:hypothetical protein F4677DRAFT_441555 [Hypoxylon crocopeplum]
MPLNAYLLYRMAHRNKVRELLRLKVYDQEVKSNRNTVAAKICGASWAMEPGDIRSQYYQWAKIEKANHRLAFPNFSAKEAKRYRRRVSDISSLLQEDSWL